VNDDGKVRLDISVNEFQLVREALRLLLSTLGREEAEELEEVRALLQRLDSPGAAA
jgi:Arc/MetJ-type ribon-helix-helix transcriptional regulator